MSSLCNNRTPSAKHKTEQWLQGNIELKQLNTADGNPQGDPEKKDSQPHGDPQVTCVQKLGSRVSDAFENFFYKLGFAIAMRPWTVILCTFLMSALCGLGMIRFEVKDSSAPIWIPENSPSHAHQQWVEDNFPIKFRYNLFIITAENILTPSVIKQMYEIDRKVKSLSEWNNTSSEKLNFQWESICIRLSDTCWSNNLLELWSFDKEEIDKIESSEEIIARIHDTKQSPVYLFEWSADDWLGGLTYDDQGRLIGAKAAKMLYVIKATSTDDMNNRVPDAPDLLWETKFIQLGKDIGESPEPPIQSLDVSAVRSFRDESDNSFEGDVMLLMAGVCIIVVYVAVILGKFNEVEHKVYLALVGVFGIGLASLVSYGLASAMGMFYGPIHPILPFLLLGLGVDDMFVVIEAWNNLTPLQNKKDLKVKIAIAMKHAGVSVTVTSITDFVAFAIGATTTLPALKSFCVYAALGIFTLYIIQSTFFVAWLTIDQRRQDASRDACCIWIKYTNFVPNKCSQRVFLPWFIRKFFAPLLVAKPIKALVITLSVCLLVISSYGTYLLRTDQDLSWFLQRDSYLNKFIATNNKYFNDGVVSNLYIGDIDYYRDKEKLLNMTEELSRSDFVVEESVNSWYTSYMRWLKTDKAADVAWYYDVELDGNLYPVDEASFYKMLNGYVGTEGKQFYMSLRWNDTDPYKPRHVLASKVSLSVKNMESSVEEVSALNYFNKLAEDYFGDKAFIWSVNFRSWETSGIIQMELYTNMGLAFAAVLIVTLFLVANIWACILVCLCVIITLINVCGFMHFWGLTIDTLTSILLILSIGLAIDYSAHIGHKFMTLSGARKERAIHTVITIGPAVVNGGFSTFLAFILLATSNSYVFITFFKVFFLVCMFGLFHGMCLLPILLSLFGPAPYLNATKIEATSDTEYTPGEIDPPATSDPEDPKDDYTRQQVNMKLNDQQEVTNPAITSDLSIVRATEGSNDEVGRLLADLEMSIENQHYKQNEHSDQSPAQPVSHHDIIRDCEDYLHTTDNIHTAKS